MIAATEGLPEQMHGASTGIWSTGLQVGTALGLAVLTAVAEMRTAALLNASPGLWLWQRYPAIGWPFSWALPLRCWESLALFVVGRGQLVTAPLLGHDR